MPLTIEKGIVKIATGIRGFEIISDGGIPENRTTLVSGTAGSGKTIFAAQFLIEGIKNENSGGVFVTFEEPPEDIRRDMAGFGWDIRKWEDEGRWAFVDASIQPGEQVVVAGAYDLTALLARIEFAIRKTGAKRVSIDSIGAIYTQFSDASIIRRELIKISSSMKKLGVTVMLTAERIEEYGTVAKTGVEEFVSDNVVILRNIAENEKRRRTIEILKFRGTSHKKGENPFTIIKDEGIVIIPLVSLNIHKGCTNVRITTGIKELDEMTGGGIYRDNIALVSGATGTGKTLVTYHFIKGGVEIGDKVLFIEFEEGANQIYRNASNWGMDFQEYEDLGMLKIMSAYPESASFEEHLLKIYNMIDEFKPQRIALDSLSSLEGLSTIRAFREFIIGLTSYIRERQIAGLFTSISGQILGSQTVADIHISTIADLIILLRFVEINCKLSRAIAILKMRGSEHDKCIKEFKIDNTGMHIGERFKNFSGILTGHTVYTGSKESENTSE